MIIDIKLGRKDYYNAYHYLYSRDKKTRKHIIYAWLTITLCIIIATLLGIKYDHSGFFVLIGVLATIYTIVFYPISVWKRLKKKIVNYLDQNLEQIIGKNENKNITIDITNENVKVLRWDFPFEITEDHVLLKEVCETLHHFYLLHTAEKFFIIPKRGLEPINEIRKRLQHIAETNHVPYIKNLKWNNSWLNLLKPKHSTSYSTNEYI